MKKMKKMKKIIENLQQTILIKFTSIIFDLFSIFFLYYIELKYILCETHHHQVIQQCFRVKLPFALD